MVMSELTQDYVIAGLILSIVFNFFVIGWFGFTGMGKDAWRRFFQKKKYRRGNHAYSLMLSKEGLIQEVFEKVEDGKFTFNKKSYVRNPRMTFPFRGIPAHIHKEDEPVPINPWDMTASDYLLSCGELDIVMNSQANFDFKEWLQSIKPIAFLVVAILVIGILAVVFFSYSNFQVLQDAGVKAASVAIPATGG